MVSAFRKKGSQMKRAYIETISLAQELYRVVIEKDDCVIFSQVVKGWNEAVEIKYRMA